MLDNILNSVKRSAERVQRRGEEVAQVARLKMEVFQLTRELDGHYARLGRAYHAGAEADLLGNIREDIRRSEEDIQGRERLIDELGVTAEEAAAHEPTPQEAAHSESQGQARSVPPLRRNVTGRAPDPSTAAPSQAGAQVTPPNSTLGNSPKFTEQPGDTGLTLDKES